MLRRSKQLGLLGLLAVPAIVAVAQAKPATLFQSAAAPRTQSSVLVPPRSEAPVPLDPEVSPDDCAVCRLAGRTASELPEGTFSLHPQVLENGALLRLISEDPQVRDTLWRVTLERGALLRSLRGGDDVLLCSACSVRRTQLESLDISARRIPEGVLLVYTSASPVIVRQIHALLRTGAVASTPF